MLSLANKIYSRACDKLLSYFRTSNLELISYERIVSPICYHFLSSHLPEYSENDLLNLRSLVNHCDTVPDRNYKTSTCYKKK